MKRAIIRVIKLIALTISGVIISIFLFMVVASLFGWHFDVVPTVSMEPGIMPGGMVISRPISSQKVITGDVVLYREQTTGAFILHRVINITETDNGLFFQTKGDANNNPDPDLVPAKNIAGKLLLYIPKVGQIAYSSKLYAAPVILFGHRLSFVSIFIIIICLVLIGVEIGTVSEWILYPESQRYKEMLRKRKERLAKRRKYFRMG